MKRQVWLTTVLAIGLFGLACKDDTESGRSPVDGGIVTDTGTPSGDAGGNDLEPFLTCLTMGATGSTECDYSEYLTCIARECVQVTSECSSMCGALGECVAESSDVCTCPVEPDCQGCLTDNLTACSASCTNLIPPCAFENLDDAGVTTDKTCDDLMACCDDMTGAGKDDCLEQHEMLSAQGDTACGVYAQALGCP